MRRTRRHKIIQITVFFLVYSIIQVLSEHEQLEKLRAQTISPEKVEETETTRPTITITTVPTNLKSSARPTVKPEQSNPSTPSSNKREETTPKSKDEFVTSTLSPEEGSTTKPTSHPTWRPKRWNCTPPAIEQFPRPLMGPYARTHGGLVVHVIVAIYTFLGLAIVCDEYFVKSLDRICEEIKLSPDVAGATFMAAGSSAPELATVVIGVFFAKDDIGVSGVIGSAVFNIMFVISVCALCAGTVSYLHWWPLCRDCFFYAISILIMLFTIIDETVTWGESLFMLCMYVVYCIALHFNSALEHFVTTRFPLPASYLPKPPEEESALVSYRTLNEDRNRPPNYTTDNQQGQQQPPQQQNYDTYSQDQQWGQPTQQQQQSQQGFDNTAMSVNSWGDNMDHGFNVNMTSPTATSGPELNQPPVTQQQQQPQPQQQQPAQPGQAVVAAGQDYYKPHPKTDEEKISPLIKPVDGGLCTLVSWYVVFPIHYMATKTMPDVKTEQYKNWYPFTFLMSMIWISFYSYIMVWMITIIGSTLGIPDTVMGLTFVAAGVSVPDALSSIAVIKEGYGDMAVSNAVGSNVFDILICLGLPWFIQTAIIKPGSHVNVISKGLTYSTLSLLSTVIFLVVATHLNGWKLDKRYGVILMVWYLIFIIFASLYELNIFGQLNPPECPSVF